MSGGYKRNFSGSFKLTVKQSQAEQVDQLVRDLKAGARKPNLDQENELLFNFDPVAAEVDSLPFTADVYIEKANEIIAIELKSVRPNSGEGRGEKQKILYAKAALSCANPGKDVKFLLGFPFDPTSDTATGHEKARFFNYLIEFKKFFAPEEVLIADELWDFLSGGSETMQQILEVIRKTVAEISQ